MEMKNDVINHYLNEVGHKSINDEDYNSWLVNSETTLTNMFNELNVVLLEHFNVLNTNIESKKDSIIGTYNISRDNKRYTFRLNANNVANGTNRLYMLDMISTDVPSKEYRIFSSEKLIEIMDLKMNDLLLDQKI